MIAIAAVPVHIPAVEVKAVLSVEQQPAAAYPGSELTFIVYIESDVPFTGIQFDLDIPEGLTYVPFSGKVVDGTCEVLGFTEASFTELTKRVTYGNDIPYSGTEKIALAEFRCNVDKNASAGNYQVSVNRADVSDSAFVSVASEIRPTSVNVTIPPKRLKIIPETATVYTADRTVSLTAEFEPSDTTNRNVTWQSSDESAATVENGVVQLLKKGFVTITAISDENGVEGYCVLTINCSHIHTKTIEAGASTCLVHGHDAYTVCEDCGEIVAGSNAPLPLSDHRFAEDVQDRYLKTEASCISKAVYYKSCSVCSEKSEETFEYGENNPSNHVGNTHIENAVAPSCISNGYTGDIVCDSCKKIIEYGTSVDKTAHVPSQKFKENIKEASCTDSGSYDEVIYCTQCKTELSRKSIVIPSEGHRYKDRVIPPNCTEKGYTVHTCEKCPDSYIDTYVDAIGHDFSDNAEYCRHGCRTKNPYYQEPEKVILGDADGNGEIESVDVTFIQRYIAQIPTPYTKAELMRGDVDGSGDLELTDVTAIQYYLCHLKTPYPIGEIVS